MLSFKQKANYNVDSLTVYDMNRTLSHHKIEL